MSFRRTAGTVLLAVLMASAGGQAADPTAAEVAQALQRRYATVRTFSAEFTQTYESILKKRVTERGTVFIQKPGLMRWEYKAPEEKLFVSDGINFYSYIRQDRQVFITPIPPDDKATTPILFLAGKGDLLRDFTPSRVETPSGMPPGSGALRLTPKSPQPEYDWLTLIFDPATSALRGFTAQDAQGGVSKFVFANWKENVSMATKLFVFVPPHGVDVVTDATR